MTRNEINKQFALLKERLDILEQKVQRLESAPSASDLASSWRARLQKLRSEFRILAVDINRPRTYSDGTVHIHRVISSDPNHFMVIRKGDARGVIRKRVTIEKWITQMEQKENAKNKVA